MSGWTDLTPAQRTSFDDDGFVNPKASRRSV
jgi:hypothetical protein